MLVAQEEGDLPLAALILRLQPYLQTDITAIMISDRNPSRGFGQTDVRDVD